MIVAIRGDFLVSRFILTSREHYRVCRVRTMARQPAGGPCSHCGRRPQGRDDLRQVFVDLGIHPLPRAVPVPLANTKSAFVPP